GADGKNSSTGAAYIFSRNQGGADNWGQVQKLTASDGAANDRFGRSVALSDDAIVVGADGKNSYTGAAYVFEINCPPIISPATIIVTVTAAATPSADAGDNQAQCQAPSGTTTFSLSGTVNNGTPAWSIFSMSLTASATIVSPDSASTNVNVTGTGTVTLKLTV